VEGQPADARSDIFSFGSTLYEMMTGQRAFQRQTITSTIVAVLRDEPPVSTSSGQALPAQLHHIVSLCLKKDPKRRIQHMVDVKLELEEMQGGHGADSTGIRRASFPGRFRSRWVWGGAGAIVAIAAGFGILAVVRSRQSPRPDVRVITLTTYPGLERFPTLSPDGKEVAFSWNGPEQDHSGIYVKLVGGGGPLRLTDNPDEDIMPSWSPDGEHIAFVRGTSIVQMSSLGGPVRKLIELGDIPFGHQIAWTHDGGSLILPDAKNDEDPYSLFTYDLEEGKENKLTTPPQWTVGDADPAVSGDGRKIAFARWFTTSSADVFMADAAGGRAQRLTHDNSQIQGLTWTPDSREIVFSSNRDGTFRIWRIRAPGGSGAAPRRVAEAGPNAVSPVIRAGPPEKLVCARIVYDFDIGRIDLPTRRREARSGSDIIASTRTDDSPRFSPDGSKVAFVSDRTGSQEIWVGNADGSHQMQLTFMRCSSGSPHWSPDGRLIVYDSLVAGNKDLFAIAADGGSPRRLTSDKYQEWRPSYSRDGNWIYFGSDRSRSPQIWKIPSTGGPAVQITGNGGYEAAESPDGKTLYYTKSRYRPGLWSTPQERQAEAAVLPNVSTGLWDVEDQGIYFFDMAKATSSGVPLALYRPQRHETTDLVIAAKASPSGTPGLSVLRDGRSVLYVRAEQFDSELLMLENFR
jgi:eukaryotic-like serine/threonine-protein kinase